MAQDILAKRPSNSNLYSPRHRRLYTKLLYTGSQMAAMLHHYDRLHGVPKAATRMADDWSTLVKQLAELVL